MELVLIFVIGIVAVAVFAAAAWRNRKQRALRQEMKRHLQALGTLGPYDPTNL
jgi:FtsZ-interacting cell division protein ZipA